MQITIAKDLESLHAALLELAKAGKRVAFVPTMGALHEGHASLIARGRLAADAVVVSVFVNPTQFGPNEDFSRYPRTLEADIETAQAAGASVLYAPPVEDIYPEGFSTHISTGEMGNILCGAFRPGHFDGVATVVAKLLLRVMPHVAIFGQKDFQQLAIIKRVVADLDIPVETIGAPTMREADGLALSSRNRYLNEEERKLAPKLHEVLHYAVLRMKTLGVQPALSEAVALLSSFGYKVDYLEFRDADTLTPLATLAEGRLLAAAWLGKTRLIDNIEVNL